MKRNRSVILKQRLPIYALIAPFIILFVTFTILPILASVFLSFCQYDMVSTPKFIGFENYRRMLLGDDVFPYAFKNTLLFALVTGPLSFIFSFIIAWFINDYGKYTRTLLSFMFYVPSLVGNAYFIWQVFFSGDSYGYANNILLMLGLKTEPTQWFKDPAYSFIIIVLVQLWLSFGTAFLSNLSGLKNVDNELFEAGAIDGIKTRWHELWYITIPSMKNIMIFGIVMQIQAAFSISQIPKELAGFPSVNYSVDTLVTHIGDVGITRYEMGYAAALSVLLFILMYSFKTIMVKLITLSEK